MFRPIRPLCAALAVAGLMAGPEPLLAAGDPGIRIELHPQVVAEQEAVTLGEIAEIKSRDPAVQAELVALPLGRAPQAGDAVALGRDVLARWIAARTGIAATQIAWAGPVETRILPLTHLVKGEEIAGCAREKLQALLTEGSWRGDIELIQTPQDLAVPSGKVELKARSQAVLQTAAAATPPLAKRQSIWVDIWVDGRFIRTAPVGFDVSVYAPAYVALRDLAAGSVFDPGHPDPAQLAVHEVEWSGRSAEPVMPVPPELQPPLPTLKLRHNVSAGQPVTHADVAAAPLVTHGGFATLRSKTGPIVLESRVEVLQDGTAGQTVRVKMPKATGAVLARVTGPGQVEMQE